MSGLPALRCFIFFAADLIILVLPSFDREAPNNWVRVSPLYTPLNSLGWMNSSLNHGNFAGLKVPTSQCRIRAMWPLPGDGTARYHSAGATQPREVLSSLQARWHRS